MYAGVLLNNIAPTGCISGRVTDSAGQTLSGKTVILRGISETVTDDNGCYCFTNLEDGRYRVKVRRCRDGGRQTKVITDGGKVNDVNFECK